MSVEFESRMGSSVLLSETRCPKARKIRFLVSLFAMSFCPDCNLFRFCREMHLLIDRSHADVFPSHWHSHCPSLTLWYQHPRSLSLCAAPPITQTQSIDQSFDGRTRSSRRQAQELLADMSRLGIQPTLITYNSAIAAIGRGGGGQWKQAVALVKQMTASGLAPDDITYNSLIVACGRGGQWKQALSVLKGMKKQGMRCDIIAYSAAISACGEAGQWEYSVGERMVCRWKKYILRISR